MNGSTIFNEDMIFAAGMIQKGYSLAYCADARVIHSHNYSGLEQLHRNFDLAVSQADHPEIFQNVPSEKEGMRLVIDTARYLMYKHKPLRLSGWCTSVYVSMRGISWESGTAVCRGGQFGDYP